MKESVRNISKKQENMSLKWEFKKKKQEKKPKTKNKNKVSIIYVTCDFNWLKTCELKAKIERETIKNYPTFYAIKNFILVFKYIKCT